MKYENIYAIGDIIDWDEQKQAAKAKVHGAVVAKNIVNYLAGQPLTTYTGATEMISITNGKVSPLTPEQSYHL